MTTTINASNSGSGGLVQTADASGILALQTAGTTAVTVDASQNVGIGTASPNKKLEVLSAGEIIRATSNTGANDQVISIKSNSGTADCSTNIFFADRYAATSYASSYIRGTASGTSALIFATGGTNFTNIYDSGAPTEKARVNAFGIGVGGAIPSSGTGITFPATQSASSDANTLDDYEEGTWTPAITFGGGSTGITYSSQQGFYTKIGNTVTVQFRVNLSSKGSSTGTAVLGGLPFTVGGTYTQNYLIHDNAAGFSAGFGMYWSMESGVSGNLRQIGTNGSSALDNTNFNNNTAVFGILTYRV